LSSIGEREKDAIIGLSAELQSETVKKSTYSAREWEHHSLAGEPSFGLGPVLLHRRSVPKSFVLTVAVVVVLVDPDGHADPYLMHGIGRRMSVDEVEHEGARRAQGRRRRTTEHEVEGLAGRMGATGSDGEGNNDEKRRRWNERRTMAGVGNDGGRRRAKEADERGPIVRTRKGWDIGMGRRMVMEDSGQDEAKISVVHNETVGETYLDNGAPRSCSMVVRWWFDGGLRRGALSELSAIAAMTGHLGRHTACKICQ
jgi:hypothetical protein